jgi:hypothetical protein
MALTVETVDAAIEELLLYKRTTIDGRTFEYQDLEQLRELRKDVEVRTRATAAKAGSGTGFFCPVQFAPR